MCNRQCLNPFDQEQQKSKYVKHQLLVPTLSDTLSRLLTIHQLLSQYAPAHRRECLERHEREMERAFQVQEYVCCVQEYVHVCYVQEYVRYRSEGKQCAICMEVVTSKPILSERRFAILRT